MPHRLTRLFSVLVLSLCSAWAAPFPLLEQKNDWAYALKNWENPPSFRVSFRPPGANNTGATARVRSATPAWDTELTRTLLLSAEPKSLVLKGRVKLSDVKRGAENFMSARAQLRFLDAYNNAIGGWPKGDMWEGTRDWFEFRQEHTPPEGTRAVSVMLGFTNSTGIVEYADLVLEATDAGGKSITMTVPPSEVRSDTTGWWTFPAPGEDTARPLAVDIGALLDFGVAGRHGVLKAQGPDLVFADGTPVRFWGTNVGAPNMWPTKEEGTAMAERLARAGFNLVRLHHMDRGWHPDNIFRADVDNTQEFDADKVDRLHHYTAELRKRGIYVWMDLLVTRKFRAGDGVPAYDSLDFGAKIAGHFNPRIIELQKDFARKLLTTKNPYTGLTYAEDPAVAFVSIINESSVFMSGAISSFQKLPAPYHEELLGLYAQWAAKRGHETSTGKILSLFNGRDLDFWEFLQDTQTAYYADMKRFLRDELGVGGLISGSNFIDTAADLRSNATLEFLDAHTYWDHPTGGWSATDNIGNGSLVRTLGRGAPFGNLAAQQARDLPFTISEWQACWPNDHIAEAPPLMAAISLQQGWDAPQWFGYEGKDFSPSMSGVFANDNKPHAVIANALAALIYGRGDFPLLPELATDYSKADPWASVPRLAPQSELLNKRLVWHEGAAKEPAATSATATSDAAGIKLINRNLAALASERTRALIGGVEGRAQAVRGVEWRVENDFGVLAFSSLTAEPIEQTGRLLVVAVARAENTGQVFKAFRGGLKEIGTAPILIERIKGSVRVPRADGRAMRLTPLDAYGRRIGEGAVLQPDADGKLTVPLGRDEAMWFELKAE